MDVAVFECDDYQLTISTATIDYAWQRFSRRVKDEAKTYCTYKSSREGKLSLYYPYGDHWGMSIINSEVNRNIWAQLHPVIFETSEYQFAVEFKHLENTDSDRHKPRVIHQLKSVGEGFKFYKTGTYTGILVGSIDFMNSPGKFKFSFEYRKEEDSLHEDCLELFVASPKLDTKNDLHQIISLINDEYENYVFDYLTLTFSSFSTTRAEQNNSIVWLSIFKDVIEDYFKSVRFIMSRPNNRSVRHVYYSRPEKIRRWSPREEERYRDLGTDADKHWYRNEQTENTTNTRENRFVKYSLRVLGKKFRKIFGETCSLFKDMAQEEIERMEIYDKTFKQLLAAPFFRQVGEFEGFRQESAVLTQRSGYSQVYKAWLMLKNSIDLIDGETDIGMKKIWELYEIWCFLIMKRLIAKVLGLDLTDRNHVHENKGGMINTFFDSQMQHDIKFDAPNGDCVSLQYQHTYNRRSKEMKTTTTEQRPDIVVNIIKPDGFVLTYLYDAKYRVQDDVSQGELDAGADLDIADYPLPDAINQMHRYRDAIYYSMDEDNRPRGKEVIGGYILFPGRTEGTKIENRYFFQSIKKVNIGAFPLLPADKEHAADLVQCNLLEKHLREILLEDSVIEHVKDSIPQKGLTYTFCPDDKESLVLVGYCKDDNQWKNVQKNQLYYIRTELGRKGSFRLKPGFEYCKYLLLYKGERKELYQLSTEGPRIVMADELTKLGFMPHGTVYMCYDLADPKPVAIIKDKEGKLFHIRMALNVYQKEPYVTALKDLIEE